MNWGDFLEEMTFEQSLKESGDLDVESWRRGILACIKHEDTTFPLFCQNLFLFKMNIIPVNEQTIVEVKF